MKTFAALLAAALVLAGCGTMDMSKLIEAAGKDSATVCITLSYGPGSGKFYRTNASNAKVRCDAEGMVLESPAPQK